MHQILILAKNQEKSNSPWIRLKRQVSLLTSLLQSAAKVQLKKDKFVRKRERVPKSKSAGYFENVSSDEQDNSAQAAEVETLAKLCKQAWEDLKFDYAENEDENCEGGQHWFDDQDGQPGFTEGEWEYDGCDDSENEEDIDLECRGDEEEGTLPEPVSDPSCSGTGSEESTST